MDHTDPNPPRPPRRVRLRGEYDLSRQSELRADLLVGDEPLVVADLRDVTFLDSTAVNVFVDARSRLQADGRALQIVNLDGLPRRVFDITGLTPLFAGTND